MTFAWLAVALQAFATAGGTWTDRIDALARDRAVETIATSSLGTPIRVVRFGATPAAAGSRRPLLLVVAGADAGHAVGVEVALGVAESLAAHPPAWLSAMDVAIVPCLNPDAFARHGTPLIGSGRLSVPTDADRDGRQDEDGGDDLDGDGMVLAMRVRTPSPATGLTATMCDDPEWPGLMRAPEAAKGETATWAVLVEGRDDDGDGRFNEDGRGGAAGGGIDLDRQWPASWPEFEDGAGRRPLQTPETRGLAAWCLKQERLVGVLVFGRHDTLVSIPEAGRMDVSGKVPQGIAEADKWIWELLSARFKEVTGINESPTADLRGSLLLWASSHLGVISMGTPVWVRPDLVKPERRGEAAKEPAKESGKESAKEPAKELAKEPATKDASGAKEGSPGDGATKAEGAKAPEPKAPEAKAPDAKTDDAKWLRYFAERASAGGGSPGFVAWRPFNHPQLGPVEIGGFVPGARANPPASEWPRLVTQQTEFIGEFAGLLPRITSRAWATRLAGGLWRIDARVSNEGRLPTRTATGVRSRWRAPTLVTLETEVSNVVSGRRVQRAEAIAPGGWFDASWTVRAAEGGTLTVKVTDPTWGERAIEVSLTSPAAASGGER